MRDMNFRAWNGKKMLTVSALYLHQNTSSGRKACRVYDGVTDHICYAEEIMQFTGLHDKNGVEVFEGDVVHVEMAECVGYDDDGKEIWEDCEGKVFYSEADAMFVFDGHSAGEIPLSAYIENITVIGNIWQNPELTQP